MAELVVGRYGQANAVTSLKKVSKHRWQHSLHCWRRHHLCGINFKLYAIVAGWMISFICR